MVLALSITMALAPLWPTVTATPSIGLLAGWLISEAALGITIGLVVSFLSEAFAVFGQMVALQAGYSFASTVDPNTQADSGVILVLAQTISALLFFALGLHRQVIGIFANSLSAQPPGSFALSDGDGRCRSSISSSTIFSTGLRMALPVIALLVMVDMALALLGRINSQLQLLSLAFPAKMLAALALLTAIAGLFPRVYSTYASRLFEALPAVTGH